MSSSKQEAIFTELHELLQDSMDEISDVGTFVGFVLGYCTGWLERQGHCGQHSPFQCVECMHWHAIDQYKQTLINMEEATR